MVKIAKSQVNYEEERLHIVIGYEFIMVWIFVFLPDCSPQLLQTMQ